jgi:hypothetical protein
MVAMGIAETIRQPDHFFLQGTLDEREDGRTERVIQTQARLGTLDVPPDQAGQVVVAGSLGRRVPP